jgi:hypothetical protein
MAVGIAPRIFMSSISRLPGAPANSFGAMQVIRDHRVAVALVEGGYRDLLRPHRTGFRVEI